MTLNKRISLLTILKNLGNIKGETFLQKYIYFLSYYKVHDLYYHYDKHHYGPYSYELNGDLDYFENEGLIHINRDHKTHIITLDDQEIDKFLISNQYKLKLDKRDYLLQFKILDIFDNDLKTLDRIELFSTMHILIVQDEIFLKKDVFKTVEDWKPERFLEEEKNEIWKILIQYKMIPETIVEINKKIEKLNNIAPGLKDAHKYHRFIEIVLKDLFGAQLTNFQNENPINQGKKRIDIVAKNNSVKGFFSEIRNIHNIICPYIIFESKNLSHDLKNPHYDQIVGRLSYERGYFGIIICRKIENKEKELEQLREIYNKNRFDKYYVLVIDDNDIKNMLLLKEKGLKPDEILESKLKELAFNFVKAEI